MRRDLGNVVGPEACWHMADRSVRGWREAQVMSALQSEFEIC
jgi:hypothetical protein